jgi:hypothetical protein
MPSDDTFEREDEAMPPWRVWRADDDGRQILVIAEAQAARSWRAASPRANLTLGEQLRVGLGARS